MASSTQWIWVWANSRRWWRTGKSGGYSPPENSDACKGRLQPVRSKYPSEFSHLHTSSCLPTSHKLVTRFFSFKLTFKMSILFVKLKTFFSVQFSSVPQSCLTLWYPMNRSMPGLPVHHQLLEFTQTHSHRVSDAIQPSHPLSSPSPPAPNPSQHQSLFRWVNSLHEVAKVLGVSALASVLPVNIQDWSPLEWTGWISLQSKGLSRVFSNTTVQKH